MSTSLSKRSRESRNQINKTCGCRPLQFKVEHLPGRVVILGAPQFVAPGNRLVETSVLVEMDPTRLSGATTHLEIGVYAGGRRVETVKTSFVGPRR